MRLVQLDIIDRVRSLALADDRIDSVLMYGSFIKGEGDRYSDVEFYLFTRRDFDHRAWVEDIRPLELFFTNEFGTEVAVFDNLIRGEFHFQPEKAIETVRTWEGHISFEYADRMCLVDKEGRLGQVLKTMPSDRPRHDSPEHVQWLGESLINNLIMVGNLLARGELAHAQQCFQYVQKYLLWLIRLADQADNHWESPSKKLEGELSAEWYAAYAECVPALNHDSLNFCYSRSLRLGLKTLKLLQAPDNVTNFMEKLMTLQ